MAQGAVQASVVFDGEGRGFIADLAGGIQAFSIAGNPLWQVKLPGGVSATPVVHPAKPQIYIGTHTGWVHALDTPSGAALWKKQIPSSSDPRILSDLLYVGRAEAIIVSSWGGRFCALDGGSGAERFSWDAGISPSAAASASLDGLIYCLRAMANQGVELVHVSAEGQATVIHRVPEDKRGARRALVSAAPVLDQKLGVVYFVINSSPGGQLCAWSPKAGALLWSYRLPNSVQATPMLRDDGAILVADLAGFIHAIGPDGAHLFRYASGCEYLLAAGVSEAGGTGYFGDPTGVLHAINRQGQGQPIFEAKRAIQARPAFDPSGNLYLPSTDRTVYVFAATPSGG